MDVNSLHDFLSETNNTSAIYDRLLLLTMYLDSSDGVLFLAVSAESAFLV